MIISNETIKHIAHEIADRVGGKVELDLICRSCRAFVRLDSMFADEELSIVCEIYNGHLRTRTIRGTKVLKYGDINNPSFMSQEWFDAIIKCLED